MVRQSSGQCASNSFFLDRLIMCQYELRLKGKELKYTLMTIRKHTIVIFNYSANRYTDWSGRS